MEQTVLGAQETGLPKDGLKISQKDRDILRLLAGEVARIARTDRQAEIARAWTALNGLSPLRPVFFCDPENGWNEIITTAEMQCTGRLARVFEMRLRKKIFSNDEMRDDTPVDRFFDIPYTTAADDWGVNVVFHRTQDDGAATWDPPLENYERDLPDIELKPLEVDFDMTDAIVEQADKTFGDLLTVRRQGMFWWSLGITMPAIHLRGIENLMFDCYDHPEEVNALMKRISDCHLKRLA
ncbi:MAG TPA: hypothetical protein VJ904_05070, partial [Tichowtungia sp.]|nr:hypothetical protein [Tichowtungia sp.]